MARRLKDGAGTESARRQISAKISTTLPSGSRKKIVRWPKGWVVALRLGENNETILDYVLLPSVSLAFVRRLFWFSEATRPAHRIERFETFEELSRSLIKRICKAGRCTKTEPRSKAKGVSRSRKRRRL